MDTVSRNIEDCKHLWWLVLKLDKHVALFCEVCGATDKEVFNGGVARLIELDAAGVHIAYGRHDHESPVQSYIPVNLRVRESVSYNVQQQIADHGPNYAEVTPREAPNPHDVIHGELIGRVVDEIEHNTENLLAAIDRTDGSNAAEQNRGTGWCAPSP